MFAAHPSLQRRWAVLLVTSLGTFMAFLDTTIVNIAFPKIAAGYHGTSLSDLSWVLNGYTIVFAAALIPAGRIADLVGRKRTFLAGLVVFTAASALCAVAQSPAMLVGSRVLEGVGAAAMIPSSLGLLLPEFPASQRATAVGLWSIAASVAAAGGTPLGGLLVDTAGWRWVFLVNVPVGIVAVVATWRIAVESRDALQRRLPDLLGAVLIAIATGALALGIVKANDWGLGSGRTWSAFGGALVLLAVFVLRSRRHPAPLVEFALWRVRSFSVANLSMLLFGMSFYAFLLCLVLFLTQVWGYSAVQAGLAFSPGPLLAGICAWPAGRLSDRYGQRVLVVPGTLLLAGGLLWLVVNLGVAPSFMRVWLPALLVTGVGVGFTSSPLASAAVAALPAGRFSTGGAVNTAARQIGGVLGVALLIAIVGAPSRAMALHQFRLGFAFCTACALAASVAAVGLGRVRATEGPRIVATSAIEAPLPEGTPL